MNFIFSQMCNNLTLLEIQNRGKTDEAIRLPFLMLETLSRLVLALAIDEVTRPDNSLKFSEFQMNSCKEIIKSFFAFRDDNRVIGTLGDYLSHAGQLLAFFQPSDCTESVRYIKHLLAETKKLVPLRNLGSHLWELENAQAIKEGIENIDNPYLREAHTALFTVFPNTIRTNLQGDAECNAIVQGATLKKLQITLRKLLRLPEGSNADSVNLAARTDIMAPIALHESAMYMQITLPSGETRLHLLSPLIVYLPSDMQFGIFYRRQNTWFQGSIYIRITGQEMLTGDQELSWKVEHSKTDIAIRSQREERLKSIYWEGELFAHEQKQSLKESVTLRLTTDSGDLKCNINAPRMSKKGSFWNAVHLDDKQYFNVRIYDADTLDPLYRMFDRDPVNSNPLYVCGLGGVGKTHTVLHALRERFIRATSLPVQSMRFKYIIFLTAKQIALSTNDSNAFVSKTDYADFSTADEALKKILTVLHDRPLQENKTDPLIKAIINKAQDPMLIIVDDLDSVVSRETCPDGESQRIANYKEQLRLAAALKTIATQTDNCRIIVTTRRPLDEISSLHLTTMTDEQSLDFARRYYRLSNPSSQMPTPYQEWITKLGKGIPAYVISIVYQLNHSMSYALTGAEIQHFKRTVADFSLFTTQLPTLGLLIMKVIEKLSEVFSAVPIGLMRIVLFDESNEDIDDAMKAMNRWDMLRRSDENNMIMLRDDTQLLWEQLSNDHLLKEHHKALLKTLLEDRDLLVNSTSSRVGDLLVKVFRAIHDPINAFTAQAFTTEHKQSFAHRIRDLMAERNLYVSHLAHRQKDEIDQWLNMWDPIFEKTQQVPETQPKQQALPDGDQNAQAENWVRQLRDDSWTVEILRNMLDSFADSDPLRSEQCILWEQATSLLPNRLRLALDQGKMQLTEVQHLMMQIDLINTRYRDQTNHDLTERFAEFF